MASKDKMLFIGSMNILRQPKKSVEANAVVVKDVPPNSILAGVSAEIIKTNIDPKQYY